MKLANGVGINLDGDRSVAVFDVEDESSPAAVWVEFVRPLREGEEANGKGGTRVTAFGLSHDAAAALLQLLAMKGVDATVGLAV